MVSGLIYPYLYRDAFYRFIARGISLSPFRKTLNEGVMLMVGMKVGDAIEASLLRSSERMVRSGISANISYDSELS